MRKTTTFGALWAIALVLLMSCVATVQGTPLKHNYVVLPELTAAAGDGIVVPVRLYNEAALAKITLPLLIDPGEDVQIDSITFGDGRLMTVSPRHISTEWHQLDHTLSFTFEGQGDPVSFLAPGDGEIARIFLAISPDAPVGDIVLDTTEFGGFAYLLQDTAGVAVQDEFISGLIHVTGELPDVAGHVQDTTGANVSGATVELWDNFPGGSVLYSTTTDGAGDFGFADIPAGGYVLYCYKDGYYPTTQIITAPDQHIQIILVPTPPIHPTSRWIELYCEVNYLNGYLLPIGSVVEAVDHDGVICGQYFVHVKGSYGPMKVYRDDPATPLDEGADSAEVLSLTINTFPATADPTPVWTYHLDVQHVCLNQEDVTLCLPLHEGWNLISWNVDTPDDDVETIIANIKGCVDVILGFEQGAASYDPYLPQFSTLTDLDHLHGYWFHMTCDTVLCVTGALVPDHTPIALEQNWNLVSYLPNHIDSTKHALAGILSGLIVALGFDNGGLVYDPSLPVFATLKTMGPGFGYWLKTDGPYDLVYGQKPSSPIYHAAVGSMKPFPPAPGVSPTTEWISLYGDGITLDGELIPAGTVLAAYDENGHLCGQAIVETGGTIRFTPVYRDDNSTSLVEGPELGGSVNLTVNGVPVQQSYIFGGLGERIRLTTLNSLSKPSENLPRQFGLAQNYPNPFNPGTAIEFSLPTASRTTLEVFNVVGERVTTLIDRFLTAGKYSVMWDGSNAAGKPVSSGMYFYRLKAGDFVDTKKMMLVK